MARQRGLSEARWRGATVDALLSQREPRGAAAKRAAQPRQARLVSDVADASAIGAALSNNGGVTFTHGLDWSRYSMNDVAHFNGTDQSLTRSGITVGSEFTLEARVFWNGFQDRPGAEPCHASC